MPLSPRTLRPASSGFNPRQISGLALWLDGADASSLYTTDAGPVTAVSAPTEISGCALWLDASDAGSITESGGLVSQWSDKSGNLRHHTASGSARPTTGTRSLNGRNVIDFDGSGNFLTGNAASLTMFKNVPYAGVFIVMAFDALNKNQYFFEHKGLGAGARFQIFQQPNTNIVLGARRLNADSLATVTTSAATTGPAIIAGIVDYTNSDAFLRRDGANLASSTSFLNDGNTEDANSDGHTIGGVSSLLLDGYIAEVVVYNTALSTSDRARVESYLAAKWGISGVHAQATATSDPVGYWGDKSGNARHMLQPTGSLRPTVGTQGSRTAIVLNGTTQWLRQERTNYQRRGAFIVWRRTGTPVNFSSPFGANSLTVNAATLGGSSYSSSDAASLSYYNVPNSHYYAANSVNNKATAVRYNAASMVVADANNFNAGFRAAQDTAAANLVYIETSASNAANWAHFAGVEPYDPARGYPCQLLEVLFYNNTLTASQVSRIERYLAAKWGITLAPQVSNADAQDWVNRVYANGGTVSASTAAAVNQFCVDIEAASIRDRFYRLNLFCGTGLNACLVPLYRGQSLGETQFGGTTDTNVGPFVTGDYVESAGLTGTGNNGVGAGNSKHLRTGLTPSTVGFSSGHLSAFIFGLNQTAPNQSGIIAIRDNSNSQRWWLDYRQTSVVAEYTGNNFTTFATPSSATNSHIILSRASLSSMRYFQNGSQVGSEFTTLVSGTGGTVDWPVFATLLDGSPTGYAPFRMGGYSIGLGMTPAQAASYNTAMQAFQTAMSRA